MLSLGDFLAQLGPCFRASLLLLGLLFELKLELLLVGLENLIDLLLLCDEGLQCLVGLEHVLAKLHVNAGSWLCIDMRLQ